MMAMAISISPARFAVSYLSSYFASKVTEEPPTRSRPRRIPSSVSVTLAILKLPISRPQIADHSFRAERFAVIKKTYDAAVAAGDRNVYLLDGSEFFDGASNDYTVDGIHPTDLGFWMMARGIAPVLREALEKSEKQLFY